MPINYINSILLSIIEVKIPAKKTKGVKGVWPFEENAVREFSKIFLSLFKLRRIFIEFYKLPVA